MVKQTAYIVDADANFVERLKKLLEQEYIISVFSSVESAFEPILKKKPDIVITEILFPNSEGLDFVASLKESGVESPVLILSKLPVSEKVAKILEISGSISKDISDEELLDKIRKVSGWKKKKVSPPTMPIISEGPLGSAIKELLEEVWEEKKNLCLRYIGLGDWKRAIEIVAFLRRLYPSNLKAHELLREVILSPDACNAEKSKQTSFETEPAKLNELLRKVGENKKNIKELLEVARALLKAEEPKTAVRVLRDIVVFSEENPYLVEGLAPSAPREKLKPWSALSAIFVIISFFFKPFIFAPVAIVFSIIAIIGKSRKIPKVVIPAAVLAIVLPFTGLSTFSTRVDRFLAKKAAERMLSVSTRFYNPDKDTLKIKYRVPKMGPVEVKITGWQNRLLISNPEHIAGVFEVEWNGRDDKGKVFLNDFNVVYKYNEETYSVKVYRSRD